MKTDSLDMIMSNTRESDQTTITTPTNTPFVQNMPLTNQVAIQQGQVHIQEQVQEYERVRTKWVPEQSMKLHS